MTLYNYDVKKPKIKANPNGSTITNNTTDPYREVESYQSTVYVVVCRTCSRRGPAALTKSEAHQAATQNGWKRHHEHDGAYRTIGWWMECPNHQSSIGYRWQGESI